MSRPPPPPPSPELSIIFVLPFLHVVSRNGKYLGTRKKFRQHGQFSLLLHVELPAVLNLQQRRAINALKCVKRSRLIVICFVARSRRSLANDIKHGNALDPDRETLTRFSPFPLVFSPLFSRKHVKGRQKFTGTNEENAKAQRRQRRKEREREKGNVYQTKQVALLLNDRSWRI